MASECVYDHQTMDQRKKMVHAYKSANTLFLALRKIKSIPCVKCLYETFNAIIEDQITSKL